MSRDGNIYIDRITSVRLYLGLFLIGFSQMVTAADQDDCAFTTPRAKQTVNQISYFSLLERNASGDRVAFIDIVPLTSSGSVGEFAYNGAVNVKVKGRLKDIYSDVGLRTQISQTSKKAVPISEGGSRKRLYYSMSELVSTESVRIDVRHVQSVSGSNQTEDLVFQRNVECVEPTSPPDLIITSNNTTRTSSSSTQDELRVNFGIKNDGGSRSSSTAIKFYLSTTSSISSRDQFLGSANAIPELNGEQSTVSQRNLNVDLRSYSLSRYYIGACLDPISGESNTGNNCSTGKRFEVTTAPPPTSQLTVITGGNGRTSGSIPCTSTCSDDFESGSNVSLTATANSGFEFDVWGFSGSCSRLEFNSSTPHIISFDLDDDCIATASFIEKLSPPDLIFNSNNTTRVSSSSTQDDLRVNFGIKNIGGERSTSTAIKFYLSTDNSISDSDLFLGSANAIPELNGGQSTVSQRNLNVDLRSYNSSRYYIGACLDSISGESNTGNNCSTGKLFEVTVAPPPTSQLTVVTGGNGRTSGAISCASTCSDEFESGSNVSLTAIANSGFEFDEWGVSGNCSRLESNSSTPHIISFDLDNDCVATASFIEENLPPAFSQVTVLKSEFGRVTADGISCPDDCAEQYQNETEIILTATPYPSYEFRDWDRTSCVNSAAIPSNNKLTLTINSDCEIKALYRQSLPEDIKQVSVNVEGQGYVYSLPNGLACGVDCDHFFEVDESITLRVNPGEGYKFLKWVGESSCDTNVVCTFVVAESKTVTAVFEIDTQVQPESRLIEFLPAMVQKGQDTVITFRGQNLPSTFVTNIEGMTDHCEILSLSESEVKALCIGLEVGQLRLFAKNKPSSEGGRSIQGAESWYITVAPEPNNAPSVWIEDLRASAIVDEQFSLTVKSEDTNNNLVSVQADWQNNGQLNRLVNVSNKSGQDIVFSYTPLTIGTLNIRFIATDSNGVKGEKIYSIPVIPQPVVSNPVSGIDAVDDYVQKNSACDIERAVTGSNPIDPASGAKIEQKQLLQVEGLLSVDFTIGYNSLVLNRSPIGVGWDFQNSYAARIREEVNGDVTVLWSDNSEHYYKRNSDGSFLPSSFGCRLDHLEKLVDGGYKVVRRSRATYIFDEFHFLSRIENEKQQGIDLRYDSDGYLVESLEPVSGAYISYIYSDEGQLISARTSANRKVLLKHDELGRLVEITHADGAIEAFTYNGVGQILVHTLDDVALSSTNYDENGRAKEQDDSRSDNQLLKLAYTENEETITTVVIDKNGNASTQVFDKNYLLLSKTDEVGNRWSYSYNEDGKPTAITDANSNQTSISYNEFGDVLETVFPDQSKTVNEYDSNRNLVKRTDQLGQIETFIYDSSNNQLAYIDKAGNETRYTYTSNNQLESETSPEGRVTQYEYIQGRRVKVVNPLNDSKAAVYDSDGWLLSETDYAGNRTRYEYDGLGRKIAEYDATNTRKESWKYDARGDLVEYQGYRYKTDDEGGATTSYIRNSEGNIIQKLFVARKFEAPQQPIVLSEKTYDGENRLVSETDEKGNLTRYVRDNAGRIVSIFDPKGNETKFRYDPNGNRIEVIDPLQDSVKTEFDELNRMVKQILPMGRITKYEYDLLGRRVKMIDAELRETIYTYDALSNLVKVNSPGGIETLEGYDSDSLLITSTDATLNIRQQNRDEAGRVKLEKTADGVDTEFDYESRGFLKNKRDNKGDVTSYSYDSIGRMLQKTDDLGTIQYGYKLNTDLVQSIFHGDISDFRGIDGRGRVGGYTPFREIVYYTPQRSDTLGYSYEANNNLKSISHYCHTCTSFSRRFFKTEYEYDANNNMSLVINENSSVSVSYQYDEKDRLIKTIRGNGTIEERQYDSADRLIKVKDVDDQGDIVIQFDYEYDKLDRLTKEVSIPEMLPPAGLLEDFNGTYSEDNRINTINGEKVDFDENGNSLNAEGSQLEFNVRDQLIKSGDYDYLYNPLGHRTAIIDRTSSIEKNIEFLVDPEASLSRVLRRKEIIDGVETEQHYVYGNGLVAMSDVGNTFYYHFDYRGSVVAITDQTGSVVQRYGYLPYGKRFPINSNPLNLKVASSQSSENLELGGVISGGVQGVSVPSAIDSFESVFGYNGRDGVLTDPNGLYFMRARYYSPDQRRFLSKDQLRGKVGNLASLNRYAYVGGDPINSIDPSGKECVSYGQGSYDGCKEIDDESQGISYSDIHSYLELGQAIAEEIFEANDESNIHNVADSKFYKTARTGTKSGGVVLVGANVALNAQDYKNFRDQGYPALDSFVMANSSQLACGGMSPLFSTCCEIASKYWVSLTLEVEKANRQFIESQSFCIPAMGAYHGCYK